MEYYATLTGKIVMGLSEKRSIVHPSLGAVSPLSLPGLLAMCFSVTYVTSYWLKCCNIPEDCNLNQKIPKFANLKSCDQTAHSLDYQT